MKGDISRAARWTAVNGAMVAGLWFGLVDGMKGPLNVGLFLVWTNFVVALSIMFGKNGSELYAARRRAVPSWVAEPVRFAVLFLLVWHAAWITASAWAFASVIFLVCDRPARRSDVVDI